MESDQEADCKDFLESSPKHSRGDFFDALASELTASENSEDVAKVVDLCVDEEFDEPGSQEPSSSSRPHHHAARL